MSDTVLIHPMQFDRIMTLPIKSASVRQEHGKAASTEVEPNLRFKFSSLVTECPFCGCAAPGVDPNVRDGTEGADAP